MSSDPTNWVSVRLREAGNILAGGGSELTRPQMADSLLFALADRAEFMERHDIDPLRESNWGTVFSNAVIYAARVVGDAKDAVA